MRVARDERGPRDKVSVRHFVKQLVRVIQVTKFTVHINEVISDKRVRTVHGIVGHHVAVKTKAFSESTVASALMEESGVRLVAMGPWFFFSFNGRIEE